MAHPFHHAQSSARKFGGVAADYQCIHDWFDLSKSHIALPSHRVIRHHTQGIFEAEYEFGLTIQNSAGRDVPVRWIGEQHVREDCRRIPTVADWLKHLPIEPWMINGVILPDDETHDAQDIEHWRRDVRDLKTILGFKDWLENRWTVRSV